MVPKLAVPSWTQAFQTRRSAGDSPKAGGLSVPVLSPASFLANISVWVRLRPRRSSKRLGEVAKEWKQHLYIGHLDMSKAFHKVHHSAILTALDKIHAGSQLKAFIANMLKQSSVSVNLGNVRTEKVRLDAASSKALQSLLSCSFW